MKLATMQDSTYNDTNAVGVVTNTIFEVLTYFRTANHQGEADGSVQNVD